jgi:hypothetical protein
LANFPVADYPLGDEISHIDGHHFPVNVNLSTTLGDRQALVYTARRFQHSHFSIVLAFTREVVLCA